MNETKCLNVPTWLERALQGLTFWVAYRRCIYSNSLLPEAAYVAEMCHLINANIPDRFRLACEVQYKKIIPTSNNYPEILEDRSRVDLVVYEKTRSTVNKSEHYEVRYLIEVKRASALKAHIDLDIKRLVAARRLLPNVTTFLVVVSEAKLPRRFVSANGVSIKGTRRVDAEDKSKGYYKVRRTVKAAHSYTKKSRSQYASLIEVFP